MKSTMLAKTIALTALVALTACQQKQETPPSPAAPSAPAASVVDVEAADAAALVAAGEVVVLDVRTPGEFEAGHIDGAVLANILEDDFKAKVAALDTSKPYVVHCAAGSSGGRSRRAVEALKAAGVDKIYHLNGGFNAWKAGQHPVAH